MKEFHENYIKLECIICLKSGFKNQHDLSHHKRNCGKYTPSPPAQERQNAPIKEVIENKDNIQNYAMIEMKKMTKVLLDSLTPLKQSINKIEQSNSEIKTEMEQNKKINSGIKNEMEEIKKFNSDIKIELGNVNKFKMKDISASQIHKKMILKKLYRHN